MAGTVSKPEALTFSDDKIQILLCEYTSLREEVLQRDTALNQACTMGGGVLTVIFVLMYFYSALLGGLLLAALAMCLFFTLRIVEFDALALGRRLREIESEVNRRTGERLLVWETENGLYKVGYDARFNYAVRGLLAPFRRLFGSSR